jgi:ATP-binding protein involved in chromosome partitioning
MQTTGQAGPQRLPGISHVIAVGSGKGGVGKSTVAVNLALALRDRGAAVGLVDADILGPSVPVMLGLPAGAPPEVTEDGRVVPAERHGLKVISMGMLTGDDNPAILRGPMVGKYLSMFVAGVVWGQLDYLIVDLPPGTGDIQLSLAQSVPLSGAVIVTTPQLVSLKIARRGLRMFEAVKVPVLGLIENMSTFTCPNCGHATDVFSHGGGERMARELGVPFLGAIPLDADIVEGGDTGRPIVLDRPASAAAGAYRALAERVAGAMAGTSAPAVGAFTWTWADDEGAPAWSDAAPAASGGAATPAGIRKRDARTLQIRWEDGVVQDFDVRDLRLACRCALCVHETSGAPLLDPATVRLDVAPRALSSIGNYAVGVAWSDGHGSGIYAYDALRALGERAAAVSSENV